jgi:hypothetical protein
MIFLGGDGITYFLHIYDEITHHGYKLFSSLLCHQSVFGITMVSLGLQTYKRCHFGWIYSIIARWKNYQKEFKFMICLKKSRGWLNYLRQGNFVSPHKQNKNGLDVGIGPKRPCQNLCSNFRHLLISKIQYVTLMIFWEKKCFTQKGWRN